jgi:hypothetical protein
MEKGTPGSNARVRVCVTPLRHAQKEGPNEIEKMPSLRGRLSGNA